MDIEFRIIDRSDLLTIIPLLHTLNDGAVSEETLKERTLEMAQQNYECLGIYKENDLIGICGMWFQTRHYAGKSCEIDHVIIDDNYRNLGIGGKMMDFIYDYVKTKNCNWLRVQNGTITLKGTHTARIFEKTKKPYELEPETKLNL